MRGALVVECTPCKLKTWNQPLAYKGAIKVMDKKIQSFKLQGYIKILHTQKFTM